MQAPTGCWDPAGLCGDIGEMGVERLRSSELRHGRLVIMATSGYIWPITFAHLTGDLLSPLEARQTNVTTITALATSATVLVATTIAQATTAIMTAVINAQTTMATTLTPTIITHAVAATALLSTVAT